MMLRVLSLGAGVQSSTLALMAAHGEIDMPDAAIFADTQWEPKKVYEWLGWLEKQLPFPVHHVTAGSMRDNIIAKTNANGGRYASVPWHMVMPDGERAMGRRQCTNEYKIVPIYRQVRALAGLEPRQRAKGIIVEQLIGISTDEALRMKPSRHKWIRHRWPLIEKRMSRTDCLLWMARHGYPQPPKSACIGCPYHSNAGWRAIREVPDEWADVIALDVLIREPVRGLRGRQFMHRDCVPLAEVDLSTSADHGQVDMFNNECEGMCGV